MVPDIATIPQPEEIRRDLEYMTARWGELENAAVFEIRALKEGGQKQIAKFAPDWIDDAVEWCERMNELGFNIYVVRNPIRHDVSGSAKDEDILASFFLWADCDDDGSADNVKRFNGPRHTSAVVTGSTPSVRVHVYWQLKQPCMDMSAWSEMQTKIAAHFKSDSKVTNPSRIMRVAGTVAYPFKHKREKGYVKEVSTFRNEYPESREAVTMEQMAHVFKGVAQNENQSGFNVDIGKTPLDRERTRIQALTGKEWHNAVIRLVASYVSKGLSDDEIHGLTDPLTLPGYTIDETRAEVQQSIDGARRKGWTPQEYAKPEAIEETPAKNAEDLGIEWFDDLEPALSDSYIVKGVLSRQSMSVVYGPSNSGKTFFALDLAFHIAIGASWRNRRISQSAVLYLAAEGGKGVINRIAALKLEHGVCDVPMALRRAGLDLLHEQADVQHIHDLCMAVRERHAGLPLVIVIDTLSRIMAGGDENSAADMTALIRNIDAIREATGAHVMLVHHSGKDTARGARGHSSLRAATDTEIEVGVVGEEGDECRAAMVTKQRDYQGNETFAFTLKSVELGMDQDGDPVSSCVVLEADSQEFKAAKTAKKGIGGNQKLLLETFDHMIGEGLGKPNPGGVGMPEPGAFLCVEIDRFRAVAMSKMSCADPRGAFNQAMRALRENRGVFHTGEKLLWRTDKRKNE